MSVALTKSRCINALRCYASYALSWFGSVHILHHPLFVSVEPASVCQLRCPECPVGMSKNTHKDQRPFISPEVWQRVLQQTATYAHTMQFYFQGEPLLNRDLPRMISEAHQAGLYTIVSTNAQAMTPELAEALVRSGLNRIIISMDGLTQDTYSAYRIGGDLQKCKDALRWLHEAKQKHSSLLRRASLIIELQCLRLKSNEHEWKNLRQTYRSLGADRLVFKSAQLYNYADGHPLIPSDPRYSRYLQGKDGHYHRRHLGKTCLRVWSGVVVTTEGEVLPCCYDKEHRFSYGNIMNAPIGDLFRSPKAVAFRRAALHQQPSICKECWK